jgi:hypothetical protein
LCERIAVVSLCLFEAAEVFEDVAAIVAGVGVIGYQAQRSPDVFECFCVLAQLMFGHAKEVQGVHLVGRSGQDRAVELSRFLRLALLMKLDRASQSLTK